MMFQSLEQCSMTGEQAIMIRASIDTMPTSTGQSAAPATPEIARWLALGAVVGPVLFTLAWLVLGFLSPGLVFAGSPLIPATPITAPISGLGLGPTGPFMNAAFVLSGVLLSAGVFGVFTTNALTRARPVPRW